MKLLLAHPTGNQFFRHLAAGLAESGQLGRVASCVNLAGFVDSFGRFLPTGTRAELARRAFREPWAADLRTHPGRELARLLAQRAGWSSACRHETGRFSVDAVYQDFDRWLARSLPRWQQEVGLHGVYGYEDGALATFTASKSLDLFRVYDLPIAYWETSRCLLEEEAVRLPAWEPTLVGTRDSRAKLERKTRELELADIVICPSQFVVDSLPSWARGTKRVIVAPFGSPEGGGQRPEGGGLRTEDGGLRPEDGRRRADLSAVGPAEAEDGVERIGRKEAQNAQREPRSVLTADYADKTGFGALAENQEPETRNQKPETRNQEPVTSNHEPRAKLRVLFAGSMSQRKGLADLFAAMKLLKRSDVELVVMGSPTVGMEFYRSDYPDFIHEPPRPHAAVLELMRTCDVLVLPSIVEGRALVMQEAMSQGLPIIITANTGGADLIEEGRTGFLVPIRSPEAIAEKIAWCAEHRAVVAEMGRAAQRMAAGITWADYGRTILAGLSEARTSNHV